MNFGVGFFFSKSTGFAFSEDPGLGPGQFYKVCLKLDSRVVGLKACNFIKKKLQHRCFPVNIAKILIAAFL